MVGGITHGILLALDKEFAVADLTNIFGPIAQWRDAVHDIQSVGIDVMGTLLDHNGRVYNDVARLVTHMHAEYADLAIRFISSDPKEAMQALLEAGVKGPEILAGVMLKKDFYDQAQANGEHVAVVDDEASQAARADVHINPKDEGVKDFLHARGYKHPERYEHP